MTSKPELRELIKETLNQNLIRDLKISEKGIEQLTDLYTEKHLLLQTASKLSAAEEYVEIRKMAKELTELEFRLQDAWTFPRCYTYHKFWEIGGCSCPVYENILRYPSDSYLVHARCPIHGVKKL